MPLGQYPFPTPRRRPRQRPAPAGRAPAVRRRSTPTRTCARALGRLARLEMPPQAIVFTGDLADRAEPKAYAQLREIVEPAAAEHRRRGRLGDGQPRRAGALRARAVRRGGARRGRPRTGCTTSPACASSRSTPPCPATTTASSRPTSWPGSPSVLATPAPHGTLLAMHHPPIPVPMIRAAEVIELHDQHLLAEVIEGTDVRGVIGGHFHFSSYSTFAGVPVSVASSTCYLADPAPAGPAALRRRRAPVGHDDALLRGPRRALRRTRPGRGGEGRLPDWTLIEQIEALPAAERHELLSAKDSPVWVHENRSRLKRRSAAGQHHRHDHQLGVRPHLRRGCAASGERPGSAAATGRAGRACSDTASTSSSGGTGSRCARSCRIRSAQNARRRARSRRRRR